MGEGVPVSRDFKKNYPRVIPKFTVDRLIGLEGHTRLNPLSPVIIIRPGYYPASLGLICRKESLLDKITPIRFRFRLGSLEYVNWMEQKPNARTY